MKLGCYSGRSEELRHRNIRIFQIYVYFNSNRGVFQIYVYLKYTLHAWVYSNEGVDMWYDFQGASLAIRDMNRVIR